MLFKPAEAPRGDRLLAQDLLDTRNRLVGRLLGREAIDNDAVHGRAQARAFALPLKAGLALLAVLVVVLAVD